MKRLIEQIMFITSHKVRKPVVTCLGLIDLVDTNKLRSEDEVRLILHYLKAAMKDLDEETRNLSLMLHNSKE